MNFKFVTVAAVVMAVTGWSTSAAAVNGAEYYTNPDLPATMKLPFSEAVRVGHMLYIAGNIGTDKAGKVVEGGIGPETQQTMENIQAILKRHNATMDDLVQCTVALADIKEWPAFNDVYRKFFSSHFPARMAYGASGLALGARVEIQCNAALEMGAATSKPGAKSEQQ